MIQATGADRQQGSIVGLHYHLHQADYWYVPHGCAARCPADLARGVADRGATLTLDLGAREERNPRPFVACSSHRASPTDSAPSPP